MELAAKKCVPCHGGLPPLGREEYLKLASSIPEWKVEEPEGKPPRIKRKFKFQDFKQAIQFVGRVAEIAESEDHHPDILIEYNRVTLELWTHVIKGLHENDFIVAAKVDKLYA